MLALETWQPGNATSYQLCLAPLEGGGWLFAWPGGGRSMIIPAGTAVLHGSYVAEKMRLEGSDLHALLAWLDQRLPIEVVG